MLEPVRTFRAIGMEWMHFAFEDMNFVGVGGGQEWNTTVWMFMSPHPPPRIHFAILMSNVIVLVGGDLGWWLGYGDRTLMNGIGAFTRESSEGLLALYSQWGHKEKWAVCNQEEWLQAGICHRTWGSFAKTLTAFSLVDSLLWFFNFLRPLLCLNYLLFELLSAWIRNCMDHAFVYILVWKTMSFFLLPP